ncbi:hypothetical protein V8E36_003032 [Tilletia maclaganii]
MMRPLTAARSLGFPVRPSLCPIPLHKAENVLHSGPIKVNAPPRNLETAVPRSDSDEVGSNPPKGEGKIRRSFDSVDKLATTPAAGISTVVDVHAHALKKFPSQPRHGLARRHQNSQREEGTYQDREGSRGQGGAVVDAVRAERLPILRARPEAEAHLRRSRPPRTWSYCSAPSVTSLATLPRKHVIYDGKADEAQPWAMSSSSSLTGFAKVTTPTQTSVKNCDGDLKAFAPSLMVGVPAVWEMVREGVLAKVSAAGRVKRSSFDGSYTVKKNKLSVLSGLADAVTRRRR